MVNELLRRLLFLPGQRSTIAFDVDMLHYFIISITMAGATLVAVCAAYFMVRYRRRGRALQGGFPGATARLPSALEISAVLGLITLFLVFWYIGMRQYARIRIFPDDPVVVYVTAKQWMWKFAYPEGPISVTKLYVPAGRPVKLIMTSRDVIHSFFVPEFRIKYDVVPGRYTTLWFEATAPGAYQILCAEFCGTDHSHMRGEVIALDPGDFARWLADRNKEAGIAGRAPAPPSVRGREIPGEPLSLARLGENVAAEAGCLRCHTVDGTQHIGPTWAGLYMSVVPLAGGGTVIADDAYITESIMDPVARIHLGYQPVMPSFLGRLQPAEVASILEYMRSLKDGAPEPGARRVFDDR